ncbi:HAMP domain-containing sensor histidine kinase [Streptomyces sp. NPDC091212]|uniref:sensor histidine kinase n=1 Tax=Streptomyces sp. NPDC091212 TaxID=3155191 RepID=UPI00343661A2
MDAGCASPPARHSLSGAALLAFVVLLARYGTAQQVKGFEITRGSAASSAGASSGDTSGAGTSGGGEDHWGRTRPTVPDGTLPPQVRGDDDVAMIRQIDQSVQAVQDTALRQMVLWSAVGLIGMALLAGLLGWWLAGRALGPVAAMTDTTRRISEHNLHQRLALTGPDDELHRLADTFDTMLDRLEKSFESQRRFVSNASHELRTPLAVQRTSLEVGLADPLPDGLAEVREDLLAANREAEQLISALLVLARSDRGLEETDTVDLPAVARLVAAELAPRAEEGEVDVDVTVTADRPLKVLGDPVLLRHLLTNLVRNAIQYNHPGGQVRVRLEGHTLTVTNTGPPVPADRVPDLFEPFRRLAQDRVSTTGHGLGLAIVRSIAEAHGTQATAEPGRRGGLKVTVRFP